MKESEKLPNKIKLYLEKGKIINEDWNNDKKLNLVINDCINIKNNIKNINKINNNINKLTNNEINIYFYPNEEKIINSFIENIKTFGKIVDDNFLNDSKIIKGNIEYIKSLRKWINPENKNIKDELLYRLSDDGEDVSKFHELCDNKGPTLTLFEINDSNITGIFTSIPWDIITMVFGKLMKKYSYLI